MIEEGKLDRTSNPLKVGEILLWTRAFVGSLVKLLELLMVQHVCIFPDIHLHLYSWSHCFKKKFTNSIIFSLET